MRPWLEQSNTRKLLRDKLMKGTHLSEPDPGTVN